MHRRHWIGVAVAVGALAGTVYTRADEKVSLRVVREPPYGAFVADAMGRALYLFTADKGKQGSTCYDACAKAWPPLLTEREPVAVSPDLDEGKVGTIHRNDGSMQVTYGGWPLYYYVRDEQPAEVHGQDVHGFGGEWYLVSPEGKKNEAQD